MTGTKKTPETENSCDESGPVLVTNETALDVYRAEIRRIGTAVDEAETGGEKR